MYRFIKGKVPQYVRMLPFNSAPVDIVDEYSPIVAESMEVLES